MARSAWTIPGAYAPAVYWQPAREGYEDFAWLMWVATKRLGGVVMRGAHPELPFDGI